MRISNSITKLLNNHSSMTHIYHQDLQQSCTHTHTHTQYNIYLHQARTQLLVLEILKLHYPSSNNPELILRASHNRVKGCSISHSHQLILRLGSSRISLSLSLSETMISCKKNCKTHKMNLPVALLLKVCALDRRGVPCHFGSWDREEGRSDEGAAA